MNFKNILTIAFCLLSMTAWAQGIKGTVKSAQAFEDSLDKAKTNPNK